jgi:hypothetical protein
MIYGSVIGNAYLMCSVTLGLVMNFFALSTALRILGGKKLTPSGGDAVDKLSTTQNIDFAWQVEAIVLGGLSLWILVAFICGSVLPSALGSNANNVAVNLIGNVCCATSILYYVSPLSVLLDIVRRGDAAGLHAPLITLNLVATTMWSAYGLFYMNDVNVYAPNITAMAFSIAQLSIKAYYPSLGATGSGGFEKLSSGASAVELTSSVMEMGSGGDDGCASSSALQVRGRSASGDYDFPAGATVGGPNGTGDTHSPLHE